MLSRFTLKKLLLLVCFLDKAKESRLIEHDPCLFCMDAEFKVLFIFNSVCFFFPVQFLNGPHLCSLPSLNTPEPVSLCFSKTIYIYIYKYKFFIVPRFLQI